MSSNVLKLEFNQYSKQSTEKIRVIVKKNIIQHVIDKIIVEVEVFSRVENTVEVFSREEFLSCR